MTCRGCRFGAALVVVVGAFSACWGTDASVDEPPAADVTASALTAVAAESSSAPAAACPSELAVRAAYAAAGESLDLLAVSADGRFVTGRVRPIPENSDGNLVWDATLHAPAGPSPIDGPIADIALLSGRTLVLDTAGELTLRDRLARRSTDGVLDRGVAPGLSVSADGRMVAYGQGQTPEWATVVRALDGTELFRSAESSTWQPVMSGDGRSVWFVSGA